MISIWWLWGGGLVLVAAEVICLETRRRKLARLTCELTRRLTLAAEDIRLAHWTRQTALTVTERGGTVAEYTLSHFYRDQYGLDCTWVEPIAVTIWGSTPRIKQKWGGPMLDWEHHDECEAPDGGSCTCDLLREYGDEYDREG